MKTRLKILVGLGIIALIVIGWSSWNSAQSRRQLAARHAEIRAEGSPIGLDEFRTWAARLHSTSQWSHPFMKAAETLNEAAAAKLRPWQLSFMRLAATNVLNTNLVSEITSFLATNQEALQRLEGAASHGPYSLHDPQRLEISPASRFLVPVRAVRLCGWQSYFAARQNRISTAVDGWLCLMQTADCIQREPLMKGWMYARLPIDDSAFLLQHLLSHLEVDSESLEQMQKQVHALASTRLLKSAITGERCITSVTFEQSISITAESISSLQGFSGVQKAGVLWMARFYVLLGLRQHDYSEYLSQLAPILQAADHVDPSVIAIRDEAVRRASAEPMSFHWFQGSAPDFLAQTLVNQLHRFAQLRVMQTALAVERFRRTEKKFPGTLADLVPRYLPEVPIDPFAGSPVTYQITEDGFSVSCVNNGRDQMIGTDDLRLSVRRTPRTPIAR